MKQSIGGRGFGAALDVDVLALWKCRPPGQTMVSLLRPYKSVSVAIDAEKAGPTGEEGEVPPTCERAVSDGRIQPQAFETGGMTSMTICTIEFERHQQPGQSNGSYRPGSIPNAPFPIGAQSKRASTVKPAAGSEVASREILFGPFRLFPEERLLLEVDTPIRIGSRALDILITMVERPSLLVSKEMLMAKVWPNLHVEPANLTVHVAALRRLLGDGRDGNRYLINIPGRGYRFVAHVSQAKAPLLLTEPVSASCPNNLPARVTRLVGRTETVAMLATQLAEGRLLTIVGPGGIGKTTVALAVAEEVCRNHRDGVWHVDLARVTDANLIPGAITSALGSAIPDGKRETAVLDCVRGKQMLLVLLCEAPDVRILATSREPLCVQGEHRYRLPALGIPCASRLLSAAEALRFSAIDLFDQCVRERLEKFELKDDDVPSIVDLCRKLDGLPLTIEFAASLVDTFGVCGLIRRLQTGLQSLAGGYRTAQPRHQTLRSMLDWSYDWLTEPERFIIRRLSVLEGDFALGDAIAVVANDDIEASKIADGLASLVAKSLVAADIDGQEPLYRLLETTRAYVLEKLQASDDCSLLRYFGKQTCPTLSIA